MSQYIGLFQVTYSVTVSYVGVWSSPTGTSSTSQIAYIKALRSALDSAALTGVLIVCADQADWSCADAAAADPALAAAVGVIGNKGLTPPASAASLGKPVWSTGFGQHTTVSGGGSQRRVDVDRCRSCAASDFYINCR